MRARSLHTSILCSLTLAAVGCGSGPTQKPGAGKPTMKMVGPSGGAVSSSDGNLAVNIPAGALPDNVTITTEAAAAPAAGAVGTVYEIGPTGTQFAMPVTLTLHYDTAALSGATEASLRVATFAGGSWQLLPGAVVDTQAKTVSGVTTHLSPYAIVTEAAGKTCATVQPGFGCTATGAPNAGGTSSGAGASTGGAPAGGGSSTCEVPTCAGTTNACAQYPGAAMDSCTDSPKGYSAACCFAPNAPICFAIAGAGSTCTGAPNGGGGSSCPPPPTCASAAATACAGYPGATLQNCTDGTSGFTGACCFAPQAPICVKTAAARACAASTSGGSSCSTPPPRCADGNPCGGFIGAKADSCTDTTDGFEATCCFAEGTLPIGSGSGSSNSGGTDGGVPSADAGGGPTGTGGMTGGGTCAAGAACTAGYRCGGASSSGDCMDCTCGADGHLTCMSCDKPDGGGAGASTGAGGGPTGAAGAGGATGGGTCLQGLACAPGDKCSGGGAAGCMDCMCGADGHLMCAPCGGAGGGTGTTGAGGSGGPVTGPCQVMTMPWDVGLPCGVMENCPDGSNYRVRCDDATGACMCFANGVPNASTPTISCSSFNGSSALVACGFPDGKI